ncbi:hypothetical protein LCGC14_2316850, partial [marine sediment metagenome]
PIALYYNLPTVQGEPVAGRSVETHPVEIAFVDKAATADTTGVEDEVTRDAMRTSALEFYHSLVKNYTGIFEEFEGYEMEAVAMDKRFDVLMVGYSLKFDIKQLAGFGAVSVVGTLVNSEGTTINTLSPNQTKTQPDITVTQQDDTTTGYPSDKDLDVDDFLTGITTFDALVALVGRGYNYPLPTGADTSYRDGDDKYIEDAVFGATARDTNSIKARNTLANHITLNNNNSFGNTNRFTDDAGGTTYANDLVICHYTGMMLFRQIVAFNLTWNQCIDQALGSDFGGSQAEGGFNNWFLPNLNQAFAMMKAEKNGTQNHHWNFTPFNTATSGSSFISAIHQMGISTSFVDDTTKIYFLDGQYGALNYLSAKTTNQNELWIMRKHTF